jgi:hypothetical protein
MRGRNLIRSRIGVRMAALLSLVLTVQGQAATKWGITAGCTIRPTCWPYYCNGVGILSGPGFSQDLGTNVATTVSADFATAAVTAEMKLAGEAFFPEFKGTNSTANTGLYWASADATVIEGYRYRGLTNKTLIFGGILSGVSSGPRTQDGLQAQLYFFRSTNFVYITHLPTLLYETGAQVITNRSFNVAYTNNGVSLSNVVAVPVAPGESFYLYASLSLSVFAQGAQCQSVVPYQVFCLNPEGLESESLRTDFPISVQTSGSDLRMAWQATRRACVPESSFTPTGGTWEPVTNAIAANKDGNVLAVPISSNEQFFRLRIQ